MGVVLMKSSFLIYLIILICIISISVKVSADSIKQYSYEIVNKYPHDKGAFTQGLYYEDGIMYEGTGKHGESDMRKYHLISGEIIKKNELSVLYFGEGITLLNNKIYQSTWKSKTMFIYNKDIELLKQTPFPFNCWGLTDNNQNLIMSNGTSIIRFLDPNSFRVIKEIEVTLNGKPIKNINELEYIKNKIYANIWQDDYIVIIDPSTGNITAVIDLKGIINPDNYDYELNVLNGIAYDQKEERLFVTGKYWPYIFEIETILKK